LVKVNEEGATIRVDEVIAGVSPSGAFEVAGGIHTVAVEKDGFVLARRDVTIMTHEQSVLEIQLIPSQDYQRRFAVAAHGQRARAWSVLAGGAVAAIVSGVLYGVGARQASSLRTSINTYNNEGLRDTGAYNDLLSRQRSVANLNLGCVLAGALGLAGLGTGGFMLWGADDPSRLAAPAGANP